MNDDKPIYGIKTVELASGGAAAACGRMLSDLGSDVIKVEDNCGDPLRYSDNDLELDCESLSGNPFFDILNSGKRSIKLDIETESGLCVIKRLIAGADVFITDKSPEYLMSLGIGKTELRKAHPSLVYALLTGYGENGPERNRSYDDTTAFWTKTGFMRDMVIDTGNQYPMLPPIGAGNLTAGITLLSAVLGALFLRSKTGRGDYVTTSLYGSGIWCMGTMVLRTQEKYGAVYPKKRLKCAPLNQSYLCADGNWIRTVTRSYKKDTEYLFDLLGYPEMKTDPDFSTYGALIRNKDRVIQRFQASFLKKTSDEWLKILRADDFMCERLAHFEDASSSEQAWANGYLTEFTYPDGTSAALPQNPIFMASIGKYSTEKAPSLGRDTEQIMAEYGCTRESMKGMKSNRVL